MSARPLPAADESSAPFWEACARHELALQRCGSCGAYRHPPRPMCPACRSFESIIVPASGRASVWSWVIVHPPVLDAFAERTPYNVAVVELDEGVRMVGSVLECPPEDLRGGMRVEVTFEDLSDGVSLPQWRPAG